MGRFNVGGDPGIHAKVQTAEKQIWWGHENLRIFDPLPRIVSTAVDSTNSPTTTLRAGLVMARVTASGLWKQYDPAATDGSQQARGVLVSQGLSMLNQTTHVAENKAGVIMIGGPLKAGQLIGLDSAARIHLSARFMFDDDNAGRGWGGAFPKEVEKAADYTIVAADNMTEFVATAAVNFTLPAVGRGYRFKIRQEANANLVITSPEGNNIVGNNDAAATTVTLSTSSHKIGGGLIIYTNLAGTKWIVEYAGANPTTQVLTYA